MTARWTSKELDAWLSDPEGPEPVRVNRKPKSKGKRIDLFPDACVQFGLPRPTPEYRFHPVRKWRIDYYFEANGRRVGLEVEGGVWTGGRHTRGKGFAGDMEKYNAAAAMGITIVRVTPGELLKIETFNLVKKTLYGGI